MKDRTRCIRHLGVGAASSEAHAVVHYEKFLRVVRKELFILLQII